MRQSVIHLGVPWDRYRLIGAPEVAAAVGLFVGLAVEPLALAAAAGLVLLMAGAVLFHPRAGDPPGRWTPPAVLGVLALILVVVLLKRGRAPTRKSARPSGTTTAAMAPTSSVATMRIDNHHAVGAVQGLPGDDVLGDGEPRELPVDHRPGRELVADQQRGDHDGDDFHGVLTRSADGAAARGR